MSRRGVTALVVALVLCGLTPLSSAQDPSPPPSPPSPPLSPPPTPPPPSPPPCPEDRAFVDGLCVQCPIGTYAYRPPDDLAFCRSCSEIDPLLTTTDVGATSIDECVCVNEGFLREANETHAWCLCPAGQHYCPDCMACCDCPLGSFAPEPNLDHQCHSCTDADPHLTTHATGATSFEHCVCAHTSFSRVLDDEGNAECLCPPGSQYDIVDGRCDPCPRNKYKDTTGNTMCLDCKLSLRGKIGRDAVGLSSLAECVCGDEEYDLDDDDECACPSGTEYNATDGKCSECEVGYFKNETSSSDCKPCEPGYYREAPPGSYCVPCPAGYFNPEYGVEVCSQWCVARTFSLSGSSSCYPCGAGDSSGGDCTDGVFNGAAAGFWAWPITEAFRAVDDGDPEMSEMLAALPFYECIDKWACVGGLESECSGGRSGPLCEVCPGRSYEALGGECVACGDLALDLQLSALLGVVIAVVLIIGLLCRCACWIFASNADDDEEEESRLREKAAAPVTVYDPDAPPPPKWRRVELCKILFVYLCIVGTLGCYGVAWPCIGYLIYPLQILTGHINILPLSCVLALNNFFSRFALLEVVFLVAIACTIRGWRSEGANCDPRTSFRFDAMLNTARLVIVFVALPLMAILFLQLYTCYDLGRTSFMRADFSIECGTDTWWVFAALGFIFGVTCMVGLPSFLMFSLLRAQRWPELPWESHEDALRGLMSKGITSGSERLRRNSELFHVFEKQQSTQKPMLDHVGGAFLAVVYRKDRVTAALAITDGGPSSRKGRLLDENTAKAYGFVFASFKPEYWWWEMIDTVRKVMLIAVVCVIAPGTMTQIVVGLCISIVYTLLVATNHPYQGTVEQRFAQVCNVCVCLLLAGGLAVRAGDSAAASADDLVLCIVFLVIALFPLLALFLPEKLSSLFAPCGVLLYRCCGLSAIDDAPQPAKPLPRARSPRAPPKGTDLTEDELNEAQDALDDFLMDDADFIWRRSTTASPRGNAQQDARGGRMARMTGKSDTSWGYGESTDRSFGDAFDGEYYEEDEDVAAGGARSGRQKSDRSWTYSEDDGGAGGGKSDRSWKYSEGAASSRGPKSDRSWTYSEGTAGAGPAGDDGKTDRSWAYSDEYDDEGAAPGAAGAAPGASGSAAGKRPARSTQDKTDRSWRYSGPGGDDDDDARKRRSSGNKTDRSWAYSEDTRDPRPSGQKTDRSWAYSEHDERSQRISNMSAVKDDTDWDYDYDYTRPSEAEDETVVRRRTTGLGV